jgi:hypothetical protein
VQASRLCSGEVSKPISFVGQRETGFGVSCVSCSAFMPGVSLRLAARSPARGSNTRDVFLAANRFLVVCFVFCGRDVRVGVRACLRVLVVIQFVCAGGSRHRQCRQFCVPFLLLPWEGVFCKLLMTVRIALLMFQGCECFKIVRSLGSSSMFRDIIDDLAWLIPCFAMYGEQVRLMNKAFFFPPCSFTEDEAVLFFLGGAEHQGCKLDVEELVIKSGLA